MHCHGASGCCIEPFWLVFRVVSYALTGVVCVSVRREGVRQWCDGERTYGQHGEERIEFFETQRHVLAEEKAKEIMDGYDHDKYKDEPEYVAEYYVYDPKFPDWDYDTPVTPPPSWWPAHKCYLLNHAYAENLAKECLKPIYKVVQVEDTIRTFAQQEGKDLDDMLKEVDVETKKKKEGKLKAKEDKLNKRKREELAKKPDTDAKKKINSLEKQLADAKKKATDNPNEVSQIKKQLDEVTEKFDKQLQISTTQDNRISQLEAIGTETLSLLKNAVHALTTIEQEKQQAGNNNFKFPQLAEMSEHVTTHKRTFMSEAQQRAVQNVLSPGGRGSAHISDQNSNSARDQRTGQLVGPLLFHG